MDFLLPTSLKRSSALRRPSRCRLSTQNVKYFSYRRTSRFLKEIRGRKDHSVNRTHSRVTLNMGCSEDNSFTWKIFKMTSFYRRS